jgi:hypothetical protein
MHGIRVDNYPQHPYHQQIDLRMAWHSNQVVAMRHWMEQKCIPMEWLIINLPSKYPNLHR